MTRFPAWVHVAALGSWRLRESVCGKYVSKSSGWAPMVVTY